MHYLENPRARKILLQKHNLLEGGVNKPTENAAALPETSAEDAGAEPEASTEQAPGKEAGADAENALASQAGEEPAAETAAEPSAETAAEPSAETAAKPDVDTALPHINNFYTTSTEDNNVRIWDLDAWQDMLKDKCPKLHLVPTEGDMTWDTEVMSLMVANTLPTGYTSAVHQFIAEHFDYGRNLVVIDLLSMKQAHCGFMILLCNEEEKARVAESERVADDDSIVRSNHIPTDLLCFDDQAGGMVHSPAEELDEYISQRVAKEWLFVGANIYDVNLLHT